jgi:hypothetical protein
MRLRSSYCINVHHKNGGGAHDQLCMCLPASVPAARYLRLLVSHQFKKNVYMRCTSNW